MTEPMKPNCTGCRHLLMGLRVVKNRPVLELSCACVDCDEFDIAVLVNPSADQFRAATGRAGECPMFEEAKEVG